MLSSKLNAAMHLASTPTLNSMSIPNLRLWTHMRCLRLSCSHTRLSVTAPRRTYATYRDVNFGDRSQLLSQSLDTKQRPEQNQDRVGPFQFGLSPSALRRGEKVQKWSELSTRGKGARSHKESLTLGLSI